MKRILSLAIFLFSLTLVPAPAQQYSNQLKKLLIDLPGWTGEDPEGADMAFNQIVMITAARNYTKGNASINTGIIIGSSTNVSQIPKTTYETDEGFLRTTKIKGYETYLVYNKKDNSGSIFILLASNPHSAMVTFTYENLGWQEAKTLAEKFDLDGIKKVADSIK
jgi:hypothetical protein